MLQEFVTAGWIRQVELNNSLRQRKIEDRIAIEAYRKNYRGPSQEEIFEARAAFGAGQKVFNVLTGTEYTT
jgi:hypothetical protein